MANNFDGNIEKKIAKSFIKGFTNDRVLSKNVNTQLLDGKFTPSTGDNVYFKRPTDYKSVRTATGDVSGETKSSIVTGQAKGTVQPYFTAFVDYNEADEALKMDQLDELLAPMATRIVTDLELDFGQFMMKNIGLTSGTVGTAISTWDHVSEANALAQSVGIPRDGKLCMAVNPYTQIALAGNVRGLGGETGAMTANEQAVINPNFAGMKVLSATTLASYTTGTGADRAGTLSASPTVTYLAAKDTMTQSMAVTAFQANLVVAAGETVTITAASGALNMLNLSTRKQIVNQTGAAVLWTGTVTETVTLNGSGAGTLVVTGPAIYEAAGQYNTVSQAALSGDVISLGGAASTLIQPNLFWHKEAFAIGSVPIKKLHSTDTLATTNDGLQFRVSKGVGFLENEQKLRIDFRPAYSALNPFFAGKAFGRS
tara:strand:- start:1806 stop:3086 length:1281 start_codon:yes stop_codon:yes gene_type:complete